MGNFSISNTASIITLALPKSDNNNNNIIYNVFKTESCDAINYEIGVLIDH